MIVHLTERPPDYKPRIVERYYGNMIVTPNGGYWEDLLIIVKKKTSIFNFLIGNRFSDRTRRAITKLHKIIDKIKADDVEPNVYRL